MFKKGLKSKNLTASCFSQQSLEVKNAFVLGFNDGVEISYFLGKVENALKKKESFRKEAPCTLTQCSRELCKVGECVVMIATTF